MEKMNKRQRVANEIFRQVTIGYVFELESGNFEGEALLENHDNLVKKIYDLVVCDVFCDWIDFCQDSLEIRALAGGKYPLRYMNDSLRFCGKDFLMQCIEKHVASNGY